MNFAVNEAAEVVPVSEMAAMCFMLIFGVTNGSYIHQTIFKKVYM